MARFPQCGRDSSVVYMGNEDEHSCHDSAYQFDALEWEIQNAKQPRNRVRYKRS